MRRGLWIAALGGLLSCACAPALRPDAVDGKPLDEFVNDLKAQLAQVHWRVRAPGNACGSVEPRAVDLRDASVVLTLERVAQASVGTDVKLVALPLAGVALQPLASASVARRAGRTLVFKLEAGGPAALQDIDTAPPATEPVAQAINAAVDGFMRSGSGEPCVRIAALKLTLVLDVERKAEGGFRIVVPALSAAGDTDSQAVNTLTVEWAHVASNGFL